MNSDPRWEDELVTYLKDFCVAVKTDGYSVPFEFSTAKRAIISQAVQPSRYNNACPKCTALCKL